MTAQFARGPYAGRPTGPHQEPHAALLIDFDNVTMGIRSDLTKELKSLLNSDIIKGKVAVQRAYADWRRYPQYIVPLAEASVDLIFAPAYGSSKKNATDIRLAIDALELVFTRAEIGTFILLSGDSDFSSLVLKLKEYGKYVIGVGIRESASDLLVQNCDEYYSYSALTGLTRAGDSVAAPGHDPWELVEIAVRQMTADGDVMRSDRLKQVILELDPNFDEKTLGFSKFNRFVQEAANRGLLRLQKMENGQFEVTLPTGEPSETPRVEEERGDGRRRRRGRGRRDVEAAARNGGEREEPARVPARLEPPLPPPPAEAETVPVVASPDLEAAYDLLRRATADVAEETGAARDSDVKRRMLEISKDWDEANYGFTKFSRFLRQAHDAQVITLRRLDNGNYEISLAAGQEAGREQTSRAPADEPRARRARGGRRADRTAETATEAAPAVPSPTAEPARRPGPPAPTTAARKPEAAAPATVAAPAPARTAAPAPAVAAPAAPPTSARVSPTATPSAPAGGRALGLGLRRGSRGRPATDAPPPLLAGQTVGVRAPAAAAGPSQTAPAPAAAVTTPDRAPGGEGRARGKAASAQPVRRKAAAAESAPQSARGRAAVTAMDPVALGLPVEPAAVADYLVSSYKGVGRRSAELLIEAFGAGEVFRALEAQTERVREILGPGRGERLLEAWRADVAARRAAQGPAAPDRDETAAPDAEPENGGVGGASGRKRGRRTRGRRGGRKRVASGSVEG